MNISEAIKQLGALYVEYGDLQLIGVAGSDIAWIKACEETHTNSGLYAAVHFKTNVGHMGFSLRPVQK